MRNITLLFAACSAAITFTSGEECPTSCTKCDNREVIVCKTPRNVDGTCKPLVQGNLFSDLQDIQESLCKLKDGSTGICVSLYKEDGSNDTSENPENDGSEAKKSLDSTLPEINLDGITHITMTVDKLLDSRRKIEQKISDSDLVIKQGTPEAVHRSITQSDPQTKEKSWDAIKQQLITEKIAKKNLLKPEQISALSKNKLLNEHLAANCSRERESACTDSKYQSLDGSCNNLLHPEWGKSFRAFNRFLRPVYSDGISKPRVAADGSELPSCQKVTEAVILDISKPQSFTPSLITFGQFIAHDVTLGPASTGANNSDIKCCGITDPKLLHPECFQITIPPNDPCFRNKSCMEFVRSMPAPSSNCELGPRQQMNQLTSYIDASSVYGSSKKQSDNLRSFEKGKLLVSSCYKHPYLPFANNELTCQSAKVRFRAGDDRYNENPQLTVHNQLFLREHNRISDQLHELNPHWDDEKLFQESRRIVIAEIQLITYREYLPFVIGKETMRKYKIALKDCGYSDDYNPKCDATINNEFATAAYRFGHSLVQSVVRCTQPSGQFTEDELRYFYNNPTKIIQPGGLDCLIRGFVDQPAERFDNLVTKQMSCHLFQNRNGAPALSLPSINCQRGRDNGIPPYNDMRKFCGLPTADNFQDLKKYLRTGVADKMELVYKHVDDIDFWYAGISEAPLPGAIVGPSFACILGIQFKRLKCGNRFWFENGGQPSSFTSEQLCQIRKTSMARIMCDNSNNITIIQPYPFHQSAPWNPKVSCNSDAIPKMELTPWKESKAQ